MKIKTIAIAAVLGCSLIMGSSVVRADQDDWYQGRQGQWSQHHNQWQFRDRDGNYYRQNGKSWSWYNGRHHNPAASAYHNRAPGDNRDYSQFKQDQGR